jgi:hypothetical protein
MAISGKAQQLEQVQAAWQRLVAALEQVPEGRVSEPGIVGDWSAKDLMGHITTWEEKTVEAFQRFVAKGKATVYVSMKTVDAVNAREVKRKRSLPYAEIRASFYQTHQRLMTFLQGLPEPVFAEARMRRRLALDTYEHYGEHRTQLLRWLGEERPQRSQR